MENFMFCIFYYSKKKKWENRVNMAATVWRSKMETQNSLPLTNDEQRGLHLCRMEGSSSLISMKSVSLIEFGESSGYGFII